MVKIPPDLWFAVFCEGVSRDERGFWYLQGIFNQVPLERPPEGSTIPSHAHLDCVVAVGWTLGQGTYEMELRLVDQDGNLVWGPLKDSFVIGDPHLGQVLVYQVKAWPTLAGTYRLEVRLDGERAGFSGLEVVALP